MNRSLEYEFQMEDIKTKNDKNIKSKIILSQNEIDKFSRYNIEDYQYDIEILGLEKTWNLICEYILLFGENENFLNINNFGEMYEIGLAIRDKHQKKTSGQYYTPDDVAKVMAKWLIKSDGINVCDVGCGTGKLILTYLDLIGYENARNIIKKGNLYLYDFDNIALKICKTSIALKYGIDIMNNINDINCDFLNEKIILPQDSKVISNPPYSIIHEIKEEWDKTQVLLETKELYSSFMEKIFLQSKSVVIITPFSFISSKKFFSLRKLMCSTGNGFIVSFDNVPGNIFYGRKHGIFNSNTTNSVRASITFFQKSSNYYGFRLSPLIRFKQTERENLLNNEILESYISKKNQIVNQDNKMFFKCNKELENIFEQWKKMSKDQTLSNIIDANGEYAIYMPNTCRYFTSASNERMKRRGQIILKFSNKEHFEYVYCMINSSFAYWYWRLFDGGITYPKNLLNNMPIFFNLLSADNKLNISKIASEMIMYSKKYTISKNNVGIQENIKFPKKYRDVLNRLFLDILKLKIDEKVFDIVHSNTTLKVGIN